MQDHEDNASEVFSFDSVILDPAIFNVVALGLEQKISQHNGSNPRSATSKENLPSYGGLSGGLLFINTLHPYGRQSAIHD